VLLSLVRLLLHLWVNTIIVSLGVVESVYYTDDPLWDGAGCVHPNNNCCTNVGLPWFIREFPITQHDNIEIRICTNEVYSNEAVLVDQLKLYIQ